MKLKISLFDKTIIRSDMKRFWWVSALYTAILFFWMPLRFMLQELPLGEWQKESLLACLQLSHSGFDFNSLNVQVILICTEPIFICVMLFSYLHSVRAATMLHSLPLSRETLLGSHTASGVLLLSAPVLLNAVFLAGLALFTGLGACYTVVNVIEWAGLTLLFNILFFSITVFVGMFTGNAIAHIVFTYILNILPCGIFVLVKYDLEILLFGFSADMLSDTWTKALPLFNVTQFQFFQFSFTQALVYLVIAFVFLAAAALAYHYRKLEAAGNIVAFRGVQPIFKYGVAICLMLLGGVIFREACRSSKVVLFLIYFVFAYVGYWAAQMLLEKSGRVWHAYKGCLVLSAVIAVLLAGILVDPAGYVRYIPKGDKIISAYFGDYYYYLAQKENNMNQNGYRVVGLFKEKSNIEAVINLHRMLIENRNENSGNIRYIKYKLQNGRSIIRQYPVDELAVRSFLKPIYESNEYKNEKYPVINQNAQDIKYIEVGDHRISKKPLILSDTKQIRSFSDIMKKELTNTGYDQITSPDGEYAYIIIRDRFNHEIGYTMRNSYKNMVNWLKERGYYDSTLLVPEDIESVDIQVTKVTRLKNGFARNTGIATEHYGTAGTDASTASNGSENKALTDKTLIKELLDLYHPYLNDASSGIYLELRFYIKYQAGVQELKGFIYPGTPMSIPLQQKIEKLGIKFDAALK